MITNYDQFLIEKNLNLQNVEMILEKSTFASYKTLQHKVLKEYGSQLYFVATFNSAILSLYPIVNQIINNSNYDIHITAYQVVLLTIFCIAEIMHVNNDAIKDMRDKIKDDGLMAHINEIKNSLLSVKRIVRVVAKTLGKTISLFTDMLAYVTLLVPINDALIEIVNKDGLNIDTLPQKILGLGVGLGIFTLKNIVMRLIDKLNLNVSSKKVDVAIEEIVAPKKNVYHTMRTKERMK